MSIAADLQPDPVAWRKVLQSEAPKAALLLDLDFKSQPMRFSNWTVDMTVDGKKYQGIGGLAGISEVGDGTGGSSPPIEYSIGIDRLSLSESAKNGLNSVPDIMADKSEYTGRRAVLSLHLVNAKGPMGVPLAMHVGLMYKPTFKVSVEAVLLTILSESIMVRKRAPSGGYLTDADQRSRHPGDKGLEYAASAVSEPVDWLGS